MYPLRGALVRVLNTGHDFPKINEAYCISHDRSNEDSSFIFIVPRGENILLLGGLAEPNQWDLDISTDTYQPIM
ncbi:hypothetical protein ACWKTS_33550 [Bacillus toyonensis]|uniref:hypothetical protein n=1 Tax=Bacillus toyonensis TaxID=155322 RepID=UPI000BF16176|nr:hypothetical protein [Bacillus toyonensis]PEK74871.1 hypothetical protein CN594_32365 [Bacillus toyonensis]PEO48327.1 hypothetical protein CN579_29825 [Bacillus toyonensis]PFY32780.1 hypothetical protein COL54_31385 [Bacillus toyonensis]PFY41828.1 hypothetical protein COL55_22035 [Bacillus toyonensis]PGD09896.1 hypothetical protein COM37_30405 [Bacillus toyonensis]